MDGWMKRAGVVDYEWNGSRDFLRVRTTAAKAEELLGGIEFHHFTHDSASTRLFRSPSPPFTTFLCCTIHHHVLVVSCCVSCRAPCVVLRVVCVVSCFLVEQVAAAVHCAAEGGRSHRLHRWHQPLPQYETHTRLSDHGATFALTRLTRIPVFSGSQECRGSLAGRSRRGAAAPSTPTSSSASSTSPPPPARAPPTPRSATLTTPPHPPP